MKIDIGEMRTKITPNNYVIAFSVSELDYQKFLEFTKKNRNYEMEITEKFPSSTPKQKKLFHSILRELSEKERWNFDYCKWLILTEEGVPIPNDSEADSEIKIFEFRRGEIGDSIDKIDEFCIKYAKHNHHYFRYDNIIQNDPEVYRFYGYKGVSEMSSREIYSVIDRLIDRCKDSGIELFTANEYKKIKEENREKEVLK